MHYKKQIITRVENDIAPILERLGLELVEVDWHNKGGRWNLCIYIDKPGGINLDDCENANREISDLLDRIDLVKHQYVLEVSSPGLERPLKKIKDFERFSEHAIKIITLEPLEGQKKFTGWLKGIDDDDHILLQPEGKEVIIKIPFDSVARANLKFQPDFKKNTKGGMNK